MARTTSTEQLTARTRLLFARSKRKSAFSRTLRSRKNGKGEKERERERGEILCQCWSAWPVPLRWRPAKFHKGRVSKLLSKPGSTTDYEFCAWHAVFQRYLGQSAYLGNLFAREILPRKLASKRTGYRKLWTTLGTFGNFGIIVCTHSVSALYLQLVGV